MRESRSTAEQFPETTRRAAAAASTRPRGVPAPIGNIQLNGGTISGNTAKGTTTAYGGGGICLNDYTKAEFNGTRITGNTAQYGGGVYLTGSNAEFVAVRGAVTDNTVSSGGNGAGVYVASPASSYRAAEPIFRATSICQEPLIRFRFSRLISQTSRRMRSVWPIRLSPGASWSSRTVRNFQA